MHDWDEINETLLESTLFVHRVVIKQDDKITFSILVLSPDIQSASDMAHEYINDLDARILSIEELPDGLITRRTPL
jgi:hypothetical protein